MKYILKSLTKSGIKLITTRKKMFKAPTIDDVSRIAVKYSSHGPLTISHFPTGLATTFLVKNKTETVQ